MAPSHRRLSHSLFNSPGLYHKLLQLRYLWMLFHCILLTPFTYYPPFWIGPEQITVFDNIFAGTHTSLKLLFGFPNTQSQMLSVPWIIIAITFKYASEISVWVLVCIALWLQMHLLKTAETQHHHTLYTASAVGWNRVPGQSEFMCRYTRKTWGYAMD